ncbi:hypothetical protein GCM10027066_02870 [Dyella jejuensis]
MVFGSSSARAGGGGTIEGGTITLVGAIVEPTCSIATQSAALSAAIGKVAGGAATEEACSGPSGAVAKDSPVYVVSAVSLTDAEADPVLKYFNNYVMAGQPQAQHPKLVTQTYE